MPVKEQPHTQWQSLKINYNEDGKKGIAEEEIREKQTPEKKSRKLRAMLDWKGS